MILKYLSFEQPIGMFALSVMNITDILSISVIERREFDQYSLDTKGGPQREASTTRINEIMRYAETADAAFPTPIILALPEDSYRVDDNNIYLEKNSKIASVVDGQHRLLGISKSRYAQEFNVPVVFILDATEEQKALIFAIINGKQTRVSASVIYDLFNVIEGRNIFKTAHEIARAMNQNEDSPFYRRLKMLGKKSAGSNESLSQGTFTSQLLKLISTKPYEDFNFSRNNKLPPARPNCIFNQYFLTDNDQVILKILMNVFNATAIVFEEEWKNPNKYILSKTTGYTGILNSLPTLYKVGLKQNTLSIDYFKEVFNNLKKFQRHRNIALTSEFYPPNSLGENKLKNDILLSNFDLPLQNKS